jgi:hypothetical protein
MYHTEVYVIEKANNKVRYELKHEKEKKDNEREREL